MRLSLQVASLAMPRIGFRPFLKFLRWFHRGHRCFQNFSGGFVKRITVSENFPKKQKGVLHASHKANSNNSGCAASGRPDILRVIAVMGPGERETVCGRFHCDDNDGDV